MSRRQGDQWPKHRAKWREQRKRDTREGRRKLAAWAAETTKNAPPMFSELFTRE
jgi:hypothetical protein